MSPTLATMTATATRTIGLKDRAIRPAHARTANVPGVSRVPGGPGRPGARLNPVRTALINRIRAQIAAGTYDTEEKFGAAIECLVDRL